MIAAVQTNNKIALRLMVGMPDWPTVDIETTFPAPSGLPQTLQNLEFTGWRAVDAPVGISQEPVTGTLELLVTGATVGGCFVAEILATTDDWDADDAVLLGVVATTL